MTGRESHALHARIPLAHYLDRSIVGSSSAKPRVLARAAGLPDRAAAGAVASDKPKTETTGHPHSKRVQDLVDGLRARLALASSVRVSMVPKNALLFSVEVDKTIRNTYVLHVDEGFVAQLTDEELEAVVAHELGHVWIFTHHPFLQTEQLANQVAMRVVNRSTLEAVYHKVWEQGGTKGEIARVLGK